MRTPTLRRSRRESLILKVLLNGDEKCDVDGGCSDAFVICCEVCLSWANPSGVCQVVFLFHFPTTTLSGTNLRKEFS